MAISGRAPVLLVLLSALAALVLTSASASGASLVAKDGKIHACYKAKGKGKGTLRVVRSAKVKCPKKWKKTSWYAVAPGAAAPQGPPGPQGPQGEKGPPGTAGNVVVEGLEGKVSELLTKVESLEAILSGVTNGELLAAIANAKALCAQASTLTDQLNLVEEALGGLSLNTLLAVVLEIPGLPGALPSFSCPSP